MRKIPIDAHVPESVLRDIKRQITLFLAEDARIRLIRIGYDDFHRTIDLVMKGQYAPFMPTLCGYPLEWGLMDAVQVVAVRKDSPMLVRDQAGRLAEVGA